MKCPGGRYLSYSPSWSPNWKAAVSTATLQYHIPLLITTHTSYAHHQCVFLHPIYKALQNAEVKQPCIPKDQLVTRQMALERQSEWARKRERELSDMTTEDISYCLKLINKVTQSSS